MLSNNVENQLILPDIADIMVDYVNIQEDIDERSVKAAALIAQNVDIKRIICKENLERVIFNGIDDIEGADLELKELLVAPLCYYTYSRLLLGFHGTYTDSGYSNEELVATRNEAKSVSKEMKAIAEHFMLDVIEFLETENPTTEVDRENLTPRIQVFGGKEYRGR